MDTMELWYRARKAAENIKAGRIHGRELDNAFENWDGDEMCAALYRLSLQSPKLAETLYVAIVESEVKECAEKFAHLSDSELSKHAEQTRDRKNYPTVKGEGAGQYTFDVKPNQQLAMF